jgi:hypothetical protein
MNRQELWESVTKWLFASENTVGLLSIARMSIFSEFQQVELQFFGPSRFPPPLRSIPSHGIDARKRQLKTLTSIGPPMKREGKP